MERSKQPAMASNQNESDIHVVMFPWFAFGHISPFLQLARKLSSGRAARIRITFISAPSNVPRISSLLPSSPSISVIPIPIPHVDGLPEGAESTAGITKATSELLKRAVDLLKPQIESLLASLKPHLLFYDFAQPWLPSIAHPLNIRTLFFSVFSAISTAYLTVPSRRYPGSNPSLFDLQMPPAGFPSSSSIASVPKYEASDFLYLFQTFGDSPCVYDRVVSCMQGCTAIVVKTSMEMEGYYVDYTRSQYQKPVLLAGPVIPELPSGALDDRWAKWLNGFPKGSVVFCSFGSETFLGDDGVRELVLGLEMTGLPFLVVLNFPINECAGSGGEEVDVRKKLPEGFEERVKARGVVHQGWVQQQQILGHESVGCFVCHAGLTSVVEGMVAGCQLVMLPQRGDQFLNAKLFAGDLEAAVVVERGAEDGGFGREAVCAAVRKVTVEAGEEPWRTVKGNHRRWREFLMDRRMEDRYMEEFVEKLVKLSRDIL